MTESPQRSPRDLENRAAVWIRTCDQAIGRHPVIFMRRALLSS